MIQYDRIIGGAACLAVGLVTMTACINRFDFKSGRRMRNEAINQRRKGGCPGEKV
uniref:Lipoprotein n=1 Tax=Anguilla anguilla TaxID=7936 RepID=A0A0E9WGK4_ANGAN